LAEKDPQVFLICVLFPDTLWNLITFKGEHWDVWLDFVQLMLCSTFDLVWQCKNRSFLVHKKVDIRNNQT
jgi:hypothetical protein